LDAGSGALLYKTALVLGNLPFSWPRRSSQRQQASCIPKPIEAVTMTSRIDKTIARQEEKFVVFSAFDEDGVVNSLPLGLPPAHSMKHTSNFGSSLHDT
jgi:hypothetical protein